MRCIQYLEGFLLLPSKARSPAPYPEGPACGQWIFVPFFSGILSVSLSIFHEV